MSPLLKACSVVTPALPQDSKRGDTKGKLRINKRTVDDLEPGTERFIVWDDKLPAFGCEVMPSGVKSYKLMYRVGGRLRKLTLGRHGAITAEEARDLARKALGAVAGGSDPASDKVEARRAQSVSIAFAEWLDRHIDVKRKPTTRVEYRRLFDKHIKPSIGARALKEVQRADVLALHRKLATAPYVANRAVAVLRSFFTWCERQSLRPLNSNPARLVEFYREAKRERLVSADEFARLGAALRASAANESRWAIAAVMLLLFTGARRGEILALRWAEVDLLGGVARLPDSKTGAKTLYLSQAARAVLATIPRLADNPFVICGEIKGKQLVGLPRIWRRVRTRAGLNDLRLHDLRHAFASSAAMGGTPLLTIGRLLGHSQPSVTVRYAHFASSPLLLVADTVAAAIDRQMNPPTGDQTAATRRTVRKGIA